MLPLHSCPNVACPVGREVHSVLGATFAEAETALLAALSRTTLAALMLPVQAAAEAAALQEA